MFTFIHSVLASVAIVGANASLAAQPIEIKSYKPTTEAIFPVVSNLLISSDEVMLVDAQFSTQDGAPESVITPDVLTADGLVFAGQKIEIVGLDSSSPHRTVLWIPESKVILGGILLDSGEHVWLADTAEKVQRETWLEQLEKLESLDAMTVIPGHYQGVLPEKATEVIRFTKRYLKTAEKELSQTTSSADFIKAMKTHFPSLPGEQTLELGAKVLTGEMAWN